MTKNWAVKLGIIFCIPFVIFGCAGLPRPDEMKAEIAAYQLPNLPEDGKAIVYVVFQESWYQGIRFDVYLDNQQPKSQIGYNMGGQYIYFSLTPGEHKILSKAENWAEINVSAKAGDIIFIRQEPYTGFLNARNKLVTLQEYEGKYYVKTLTPGTTIDGIQQKVATAPIASSLTTAMPSENQNTLGINVGPTSGPRGVTVITVVPGSPCASVLNPGDRIFTFELIDQNGSRVGHQRKINANNFQEEVSKIQPGMTVKMSLGPFKYVNCTIPAAISNAAAVQAQSAQADTFIGTVTGGNMAKGVGFSNLNVKLEVTADNGDKTIFYVRSDSKVIDASGKQIDYLEASRTKGKKVEIEHFIITDATGGDPSRSDFAFEIGKKGVRLMRFLDWKSTK